MKKEGIPGHPEVAKRLLQARVGAGLTQAQLADRVSAMVDTIVSRSIISRTEKGERDAETRLVWAIAQTTGESMDWLLEPLNKLREVGLANPGYARFAPTDTRHEAYLLNSGMARVDHRIGDCINCLLDPDFHAAAEWTDIPGQLVIDLRDEALERFLQGAA